MARCLRTDFIHWQQDCAAWCVFPPLFATDFVRNML